MTTSLRDRIHTATVRRKALARLNAYTTPRHQRYWRVFTRRTVALLTHWWPLIVVALWVALLTVCYWIL